MTDEDDRVREHLAALDRPTIPEDVAHRLDAAIAAEAGQSASPATPRIPLQASPPRRRRVLYTMAGAAAAIALFAMVDPLATSTVDPEDAALAPPTALDSVGDAPEPAPSQSSGQADTDRPVVGDAQQSAPDTGQLERISRVAVTSDTEYTRTGLASQAGRLADGTAESATTDPAEQQPWAPAGSWPAATLVGAWACVAALSESAADVVALDRARFEGEPALVVALDLGGGVMEIVVQDVRCTADDPAIRYRATVVR